MPFPATLEVKTQTTLFSFMSQNAPNIPLVISVLDSIPPVAVLQNYHDSAALKKFLDLCFLFYTPVTVLDSTHSHFLSFSGFSLLICLTLPFCLAIKLTQRYTPHTSFCYCLPLQVSILLQAVFTYPEKESKFRRKASKHGSFFAFHG